MTESDPCFLVLGAGIGNTNRGVAALGTACIDQLSYWFPNSRIILADGGVEPSRKLYLPDREVNVEVSFVRGGGGILSHSSLSHLRAMRWTDAVSRGMASKILASPTWQQLRCCDAVLDFTGGDSFADTYTSRSFQRMTRLKRFMLDACKPYVMMPQTYGPFHHGTSQHLARHLLKRSALVATRDKYGLDALRGLLGGLSDTRFVACPDVAFVMSPMPLEQDALPWHRSVTGPLLGLNVSGLLWQSNLDFNLHSDYRALMRALIKWAMSHEGARLLLVPHVFNKPRATVAPGRLSNGIGEESDLALAKRLHQEAASIWGERVLIVDQPYSAPELKWIIGHCDFFVGARMHACIAAASQAIPTVTLAYSKKAEGVMGMLEPRPPVVDLRSQRLEGVLRELDRTYAEREHIHSALVPAVERAQQRVREFFARDLPDALSLTRPSPDLGRPVARHFGPTPVTINR